jgi:serine/threonine protein kinase
MNFEQVVAKRSNKTIYRSGDRCVKLFNEGYSKADILNEALNASRIEEKGLNIPRILEVTTIDGRWAMISQYIEGKTLAEIIDNAPEKKEEYTSLLVDIQLQIHRETCPLLNRLRDKLDRKLVNTDLDATTRYDLHNKLDAMPRGNSICHGDLSPSNIIITDDGVPFILDWSHATQGNPLADAAKSYILYRLRGDGDGAALYLNIFCEKSGAQREDILRWVPIIAAALSSEKEGNEEKFLLSLVNGKNI